MRKIGKKPTSADGDDEIDFKLSAADKVIAERFGLSFFDAMPLGVIKIQKETYEQSADDRKKKAAVQSALSHAGMLLMVTCSWAIEHVMMTEFINHRINVDVKGTKQIFTKLLDIYRKSSPEVKRSVLSAILRALGDNFSPFTSVLGDAGNALWHINNGKEVPLFIPRKGARYLSNLAWMHRARALQFVEYHKGLQDIGSERSVMEYVAQAFGTSAETVVGWTKRRNWPKETFNHAQLEQSLRRARVEGEKARLNWLRSGKKHDDHPYYGDAALRLHGDNHKKYMRSKK